jgi:hypothetical protein
VRDEPSLSITTGLRKVFRVERDFIALLIPAMILVQSCGKEISTDQQTLSTYPVHVEFQGGFNNDSAVVMIDGIVVASVDSITTNPIILLAATRQFSIVPGEHVLTVALPRDTVRVDTAFVHIQKELWIGVNHNRAQRMMQYLLRYSPFPYR